MSTITTKDGTTIHFKDWGSGRPVVLSHGWPLSADSWESQAFHLASNGFRVVTHERRGHGRSSPPWDGNDMDHYADDLAQLIEHLALEDAMLVGFSTVAGKSRGMSGDTVLVGSPSSPDLGRSSVDGEDCRES